MRKLYYLLALSFVVFINYAGIEIWKWFIRDINSFVGLEAVFATLYLIIWTGLAILIDYLVVDWATFTEEK